MGRRDGSDGGQGQDGPAGGGPDGMAGQVVGGG